MECKIEVKLSPGRGRGVFARRHIQEGELVETCPVILVESARSAGSVVEPYTFVWSEKMDALPLGYGCLYNHSYSPNVVYKRRIESMEIDFIALTNIDTGAELVANYNGDPLDRSPLDFEIR